MNDHSDLVFLHGLCDDHSMWAPARESLADIAASQAPDLLDIETVAESAAQVLRDAPERFALAGFSMGGYVAFEILRQAPERVTRLALINTTARADAAERTEARQAMIARIAAGDYEAVVAALVPQTVKLDGPRAEAVIAEVRAMAKAIGPEAFVRQLRVCMSRPDSRSFLPEIACPTLVLCGQQDSVLPPELSREMAEAIPGAELVLLEDCGHYAPLEQPEAFSAALRTWLKEA